MSQNVFETPEAFNEYAGQLAARLRTRWEARILFLQQGIAQLQALKRVAEAVRDEQTLSEVSAQLVGAQEELQRLQTAIGSAGDVSTSSAAGGAGNPESTPPSSQPEMVAAVPPAPAVVEAAPAPLLPAPPPTEVAQPPGVVAPAPPVDPEESRPAAPAPPVVLEPVPAAPMGTVSAPLSPPPAVWEQPAAAAVEETLPAPPWKEGPNKAGADPAVQAAVLFQKPVPEAPKGAEAKSSPAPVAEPEHLDLDFEVLPPAAPAPEARPDPSGTWVGPVPTAAAVPEPATPVAEGWMDRTRRLHLDLATGDQRLEWVQNRSIGEKLGGIGRSFAYIRDHYTRIRDAFDPENPLVVNVGCTTGTKAMTGLRIYFTAFSPLKQSREDDPGIAYSAASGDFGTYFRRTGLDDLVLTGRAAQPSLLVLEGDGETITARVEDGSWLCGLTTNQKVQALKPHFPDAHFAVIGPAGENLVRYAAIACSTERQTKGGKLMRFAGRAGMGAVLWSKNLLGIVARGTMKIPNLAGNASMVPFNKEVSRGEGSARYRDLGTWPFNIEALTGPKGGLPIRNFSIANDTRARALYVGRVRERYGVEDHNCTACGIKCWKVLTDGPEVLAKLDHEPLTLLGPNLDIWDIGQIAHLVELGDEYGMDSISLGGVLGFAMEHALEGLEFGDPDGAADAIRRIGTGQSPLLAQGVRRIARQIGQEGTAIHVHGLELAAYLGNTDPGAAFSLVGNHMTMQTFNSAINKLITTVDQWEEEIVQLGIRRLTYDMIGLCKFANTPFEQWTPFLAEYGIPCSVEDLFETSLEAYRIGRNLDYQQGFTSEDDTLPDRCFHQIPGQGTPQFMTREFFEQLKPRVYAGLRI